MKRIKNGFILIILICIIFIGKVDASINSSSIAAVASSGELTKEYKERHSEYSNFKVEANSIDENTGTITMTITKKMLNSRGEDRGDVTSSATLSYYYDSDNYMYVARDTFDEERTKEDNFYVYKELYSMFPFWTIEADSNWKNLESLFLKDSSKLSQLEGLIDKCYMTEYGVCFTIEESSVKKTTTYISKAENTDKTYKYVKAGLEQNRREANNTSFLRKLAVIFIILVVVYVIALSYKKQADNEEYAKKKKNYKQIEIVSQKK